MKKLTLILIMLLFCTRSIPVKADDAPSAEELKQKVEESATYKEITASGFQKKNKDLELAIVEVMATHEMTEHFGKSLTESQLDFIGAVLAYSNLTKGLPKALLDQIKKSPNLAYVKRKVSAWEQRTSTDGDSQRFFDQSEHCYFPSSPGNGEFLVFPNKFDVKLDGKSYAQVVHLDPLERGKALLHFLPRSFITKTRHSTIEEYQQFTAKKYKPAELGSNANVSPESVKEAQKEAGSKYVQIAVSFSEMIDVAQMAGGKGVVINSYNKTLPGPPALIEVPFKEVLEHLRQGGWKGPDRPGCEEDVILLTVQLMGTKQLPNKLGVMMNFTLFKTVAGWDEWSFFHE